MLREQIGSLEVVGDPQAVEPQTEQILRAIDSDTALVSLSHVTFRSGSLYPMREITTAAHPAGALVLWDLSHSVGCVPIELDADQFDRAVHAIVATVGERQYVTIVLSESPVT